ncbi:hypothetical protein HYH03_003856 [Edaphochlamys debaryana]|uniref:Uncharacterized protein n=1 Tax=Edaphochlamys debaryana TaxID=47281 RepID=A0A835YB82_9CHLO|nr:hypothetical protein HYH03_003856 [Edaphochlamys debaryana]|eukprot:KAG2498098.1 hypothetical protein HYH03_003856 [Edaphochlamys debaryana]
MVAQLLARSLVLGAVLLLSTAAAEGKAAAGPVDGTGAEPTSASAKRELYQRAFALRAKRNPTWAEYQKAAEYLVGAVGFRSLLHGKSFPFNGTARATAAAQQPGENEGVTQVEGFGGAVNVSDAAHRGALRELAKAFQDGAGVPQDMRLALELFRLASAGGDPEAQGHMGLRFSVGLDEADCWAADGIVRFGEPKPQEALLHYFFGAAGGDLASRMALGYRHLNGLGVPRSCWSAAAYYQPVGEEVSDLSASGSSRPVFAPGDFSPSAVPAPPSPASAPSPAGAPTPSDPPPSPAPAPAPAAAAGDEAPQPSAAGTPGGASGPAGSSPGAKAPPSSAAGSATFAANEPAAEEEEEETPSGALPHVERIRLHLQSAGAGLRSDRHREVVQYYQYSADRGNTEAQTAVGQVLNYGTHGVDRDHGAALSYFLMAATAGDVDAMGHLGAMYANGYGTKRSYESALEWWTRAARRNNAAALFGLGYLYLTARGVAQDYDRAFQYFSKAAEQLHSDARPDALFYMGVMHLRGYGVRRKSVQRALSYFTLAAHAGHSLAQYNAAVMHLAGKGTPRNCKPAVSLLKALAEKGPAAASVQLGHEHFFRGRYSMALLSYLRAADLGIEVAQSNAAWMLERGYAPGPGAAELAFSLYKQSAAQLNAHSLLCMADAYYFGRGVGQDWVRSAAIYYDAYQERSPEAMFNLGFMHEFGAGVPQDLALAQRFYNMAKHTQADAFLPVALANAWLKLHMWWEKLRPHLPSSPYLDPIWNAIFVLPPPKAVASGASGPGGQLISGAVETLSSALHAPWIEPYTTAMQPYIDAVRPYLAALAPSKALFRAEVTFWRWVDVSGLSALLSSLRVEDAGESMTLLALLGGLALVVRLRRRRAEARMVVQQEAARQLLERQRVVVGAGAGAGMGAGLGLGAAHGAPGGAGAGRGAGGLGAGLAAREEAQRRAGSGGGARPGGDGAAQDGERPQGAGGGQE